MIKEQIEECIQKILDNELGGISADNCPKDGIEKYRRKLYNFKDYLGSTDGYTFFNDYYVDKMMDLEDKYNLLENVPTDPSMYLIKKKTSKFLAIFRYIKNLFVHNGAQSNVDSFENNINK